MLNGELRSAYSDVEFAGEGESTVKRISMKAQNRMQRRDVSAPCSLFTHLHNDIRPLGRKLEVGRKKWRRLGMPAPFGRIVKWRKGMAIAPAPSDGSRAGVRPTCRRNVAEKWLWSGKNRTLSWRSRPARCWWWKPLNCAACSIRLRRRKLADCGSEKSRRNSRERCTRCTPAAAAISARCQGDAGNSSPDNHARCCAAIAGSPSQVRLRRHAAHPRPAFRAARLRSKPERVRHPAGTHDTGAAPARVDAMPWISPGRSRVEVCSATRFNASPCTSIIGNANPHRTRWRGASRGADSAARPASKSPPANFRMIPNTGLSAT